MPADAVGREIAIKEAKDTIKPSYGVLDPAAFSEDGGPSIHERMWIGSDKKILWRRADNSRVAKVGSIGGWDQLRSRLIGESDSSPMLVVFNNCLDTIRTLPIMQHDKDRVEDIDTTQEDHAVDEIRYACMSRPYVRSQDHMKEPKFWEQQTLNELWGENKQGKRL
jgi:hypothetical protein